MTAASADICGTAWLSFVFQISGTSLAHMEWTCLPAHDCVNCMRIGK